MSAPGPGRLTRTLYTDNATGLPRSGSTARRESQVDDQSYRQVLDRAHAHALHGPGVAAGLDVSAEAGTTVLRVGVGVALDGSGRHILLANGGQARVSEEDLVPVDSTGAALPVPAALPAGTPTGRFVLTIAWAETFDSKTFTESSSTINQVDHTPRLRLRAEAGFVDDGAEIALAVVEINDTSIVSIAAGPRAPAGSLPVRTPVARLDGATLRVQEQEAGSLAAHAEGGLELRVPRRSDTVAVRGREEGRFALLSVAADRITGERADGTATFAVDTTTGDLRVDRDLSTTRGMLRFGTDTPVAADKVVGALGFVGFGVQHGQLSFRAGSGFELVDRSADFPALDYARHSRPYASLALRHLDLRGDHNPDVPVFERWSLMSAPGRLHLSSEEDLFLLGKGGVHVSRAWGGDGELTVDGDLIVGGTVQGGLRVAGQLTAQEGLVAVGELAANGPLRAYAGARLAGDVELPGRVVGDVTFAGRIGTGGKSPVSGIPGGWGGGVHTWDVYAEGTIGVGTGNGQLAAWMDRTGKVSASVKRFVIPHPLDPARRLVHASIEGPESAVYYRGTGELRGGEAVVTLPSWFEALARADGRTVLLTPMLSDDGGAVPVLAASPVRDGRFRVRAATAGARNGSFAWQVCAVRADLDPLEVEPPAESEP